MKKILSIIAALVCVLTVSAQSVEKKAVNQRKDVTALVAAQCSQTAKCVAQCEANKDGKQCKNAGACKMDCKKQCDKSGACKMDCKKQCGKSGACKMDCKKQCDKSGNCKMDCKKQCKNAEACKMDGKMQCKNAK